MPAFPSPTTVALHSTSSLALVSLFQAIHFKISFTVQFATAIPCYTMLYNAMPCHTFSTPCHTILHHAMLFYVMPYYFMPCYEIKLSLLLHLQADQIISSCELTKGNCHSQSHSSRHSSHPACSRTFWATPTHPRLHQKIPSAIPHHPRVSIKCQAKSSPNRLGTETPSMRRRSPKWLGFAARLRQFSS